MAKCFISYSHGYRHIMETISKVLKALGYQSVDVFNEPDDERPPTTIVQKRILDSECVLVLYGPQRDPGSSATSSAPAKWPYEEALFAYGRRPLTFILHSGTELPELLRDKQTPPRFNFWDPSSFQENVHNVIKHLLDFQRRVDGRDLYQNLSFVYQKVEANLKIGRSGKTYEEGWYHEVTVTQQIDCFHHALTTGSYAAMDAAEICFNDKEYDLDAPVGGDWHQIKLIPQKANLKEAEYLIQVNPALQPGELFGYRRSFELPNRFPLNQSEIKKSLIELAKNPTIPIAIFEDRYYGDSIDVVYPAQLIVLTFTIPKRFKVRTYRVVVVDALTKRINQAETDRCNTKELLVPVDEPSSPDLTFFMKVPQPLMQHNYYLMYETVE